MKQLPKFSILAILAVIISSCCLIKTEFSEAELKWIDPYEEGDTLIFRSTTGEMDTSWIVQKIIYYPECNPIAHDAKYKHQTARIYYQNSKLNYSSGGKELISVVKYEDYPRIHIFYLNKGFSLDSPEMMELRRSYQDVKRIESESIYIFTNYHPKTEPEDVEFLYWHDEYGLIKYILHNGEEWRRINLDVEIE
ncbi:MAG: hypothetical protein FD170_309 [Bacteroidetes bacterium]|nr:MAG: hypothetical protein FD170_309 [Bacteroidota bacterium]